MKILKRNWNFCCCAANILKKNLFLFSVGYMYKLGDKVPQGQQIGPKESAAKGSLHTNTVSET
jgi:hypothetical protein